jgi:hypothetical protein
LRAPRRGERAPSAFDARRTPGAWEALEAKRRSEDVGISLAVPVFGQEASLTLRLAAPELGRRLRRSSARSLCDGATAEGLRPGPPAAFAACPGASLRANDRRAGRLDPQLRSAAMVEHSAGRTLTQITVGQGRHSDFQDRGRSPHDSPHGLYRGLILAHGQRVTLPRKCGFTRECRHAISLLIMV